MLSELEISELNLDFYKYDNQKNQFYINNRNISSYFISREQITIYNYFDEKNIQLYMDKNHTITINY